ncbi:hypothetical protein AB3Y40_12965 [Yoonia sp. R2331]|uniref:hypothetical protein n=1 Tax=Yoonia sp. R2331 TaxID=3237238 RepID=UPI0034E38EBA
MFDVYEYRQSGRSQLVWLSAAVVIFLLTFGLVNEAPNIIVMVFVLAGVVLGWVLMLAPARGIRVDDAHLTLNAWSRPRQIALDDIAFLRAVHWTADSAVTIVYKDGTEESTHPRDMPDLNTLARVMANRGVKLKDPGMRVSTH